MHKKDDLELTNLRVRNVHVGADGSVLIALEEYYSRQSTTTNSDGTGIGRTSSTSSSTTYYYEDILAMPSNDEGMVDWMRKIPKRQSGGNAIGTMSFKLVSDETGYYFLSLDNIHNLDLGEEEASKSYPMIAMYSPERIRAFLSNTILVWQGKAWFPTR